MDLSDLDSTTKDLVRKMRETVETLRGYRDRAEQQIADLEAMIRKLDDRRELIPETFSPYWRDTDNLERTPGGRLTGQQTRALEAESGRLVYEYLLEQEDGAQRAELLPMVHPILHDRVPRVVIAWNENNPEQQIETRGRGRGSRYVVAKKS